MENFFGIPWAIAAVIAIGIAILYTFLWPKPKGNFSRWTYLILRWAHSLVWWLLALTCIGFSGLLPLNENFTGFIAWSALVVYFIFLGTLIYNRSQKTN